MSGFGGSVKLTGESEYRKALQGITQDLSKMSSALKQQTADYANNDKSISNTATKQKELSESIKAQQAELAKAKNAYAQFSVQLQAQQTRHNALTKEYRSAVLEMDKIKATCGETSEEYKKQAQVVDKLEQEMAQSTAEMNESKSAMASLKSEINNSQKSINSAEKAMEDLGEETKDAGESAEKASDGFTVMKGVLANLATQAINSALNGLKQLAGAFVDVGKQALSSYGEFEQLEGGVEKIFGDEMAQTVMDNAQNAFKTAGMSANEYMETVTGFSSSLIQSLDGDTAKATEIADRAIRDMSDNANTFGTDMSSIQYAYQGFAKQNYTMLDNLKLGYGGTKEEMQRLIADASQMTDIQKELGITVDENDMSFANIANAISVVQKNMGIMNTTAKEADGTIQGSTGSMKSAWQNMITGMADENANFTELASNFIGTLITEDGKGGVIGTIVPRIATVITGMGEAINTLLPQLIQAVVPVIQENLPIIMEAISGALQTILALLPEIVPVIADLIPQIVSTIVSLLPEIVNAGIQLLLALIEGINETIPQLIEMLPEIIDSIVTVLLDNLPLIIQTGMDLLVALIEGLADAIPQLIDYVPKIISTIVEVLIKNLPQIVDSAVKIMVALINGLIQSLPQLIAMTPKIIVSIVKTLVANLPQIIKGGVQIITSLISGIVKTLGNLATNAKKIITTVVNALKDFPKKMLDVGKNLVKGIWEGISDSFDWIKSKIKGWVGNVTGFIKKLFGIHSPSKLFKEEIGENLALGIGEGFSDEMKNVSEQMGDAIPKSFDVDTSLNGTYAGAIGSVDIVGAFKQALSEMKIELDDEVAGRFIDKTVTRLIYT